MSSPNQALGVIDRAKADSLYAPLGTIYTGGGNTTASGDGVTDDTDALNADLAEGGYLELRYGGTYLISAPLVIGSDTFFNCRGATITLIADSDCNMLQTPAVAVGTGGSRCSNVRIEGGIWDRGGNIGAAMGLHSLVFYKADGLVVRDLEYKSTAGKYGLYFVDCTDALCENIHFTSAASDAAHLHVHVTA